MRVDDADCVIPDIVAVLEPAMKTHELPTWSSAKWVGALDLPARFAPHIKLVDSAGYRTARLLVRQNRRPVTFIEVDIVDDQIDGAALEPLVSAWNAGRLPTEPDEKRNDLPFISVVICTRNRTAALREALGSVLACEYPNFEVVVVDNASDDESTSRYVGQLSDSRVRIIFESTPGLSCARNAGIRAARGELIAFTDDDVVVDRGWLRWFGSTIDAETDIGCVTGLIPSGELRTPTQWIFENQVHWSSLTRQRFHIEQPPEGNRLFPFQVGVYGTGANFAMPRSVLLELGGFDEGLGIGSPAGGGEDIDMFVRVLLSGRALVYEPSVIAWHRHRADLPALAAQAHGYGLGLGAWLTKIACDRTLRPMALKRLWDAVLHMRGLMDASDVQGLTEPSGLRRTHFSGLVRGPFAYVRSRRQHREARPLADWPADGSSRARVGGET